MDAIEQATLALLQARRDHQPAPPLSVPLPDALAAYAVQDAVAGALDWFEGRTPRFWKSGGATLAQQTHAPLPPQRVLPSPVDARGWPLQLRGIEAEIALRLARPVSPADAAAFQPEDASELIDAMCVAIELVDSRWAQGVNAPHLSKLADLQSHGALVLGAWVPFAPRDWAQAECTLRVGAQAPSVHRGAHPLGTPAGVLGQWLRHATRHGAELAAGSVVTTGSWNGLAMAQAGDFVHVAFPGIGEASLQL